MKRKKDLPSDPDSEDVFYSNLLEKYMEHPAQLENVLYVEWAETYMINRSSSTSSRHQEDDEASDNEEDTHAPAHVNLVDQKGRRWKKRNTEAVARWKFYLPNGEDQEKYYMQKLILNVPLRKDTPVISPNNVSGTYMEECAIRQLVTQTDDALTALQDARRRGFSLDRLRRMAQSLRDMEWIGEDEFNVFIDEVTTVRAVDAVDDAQEVTDADFDPEHAHLADLGMKSNHIDLAEFEKSLSPSQKRAYNYITQFLSTGDQLLTAIVGEAGTGKSYLLKGIMEHAISYLNLTGRILATTGAAAHLIGGETVHHFFQMNIEAKSRLETGTLEYELVSNTDLIIIDEFSLLEMKPFLTMDRILREMAPTNQKQHMPFGGKHIILMGDPAQLPVIEQDIFDTFLWKRFHCVMLTDVKRQKDETFQRMLSTIRLGYVSDDINSVLRSKVVPASLDIDSMDLSNGAIICSLRKERDAWNKQFLDRLDAPEHTFEAIDTDVTGNDISETVKGKIRRFHRERLEDTLTLKVGARVVLCKNIDVEHGWLNGTLAVITAIHANYITIESTKTGRRTVVTRMKQNVSFPGSAVQYIRTQFPLILGWALTVHKVQGMTLETVYVLLNKIFFASGQAYVALSRVKSLDNLHLLQYDPSAVCLQPYYRDLLRWMKHNDKIKIDSDQESSQVQYPKREEIQKPTADMRCKRKKPSRTDYSLPQQKSEGNKSRLPPRKKVKLDSTTIEVRVDSRPPLSHLFANHSNISNIWQRLRIQLPLAATREQYLEHGAEFEELRNIMLSLDVLMFDLSIMQIDVSQQHLLHPVVQQYLAAAHTIGDGNCLFYSIWKQLFPSAESVDCAVFIRPITLYNIHKHEQHFRRHAGGFQYSYERYISDIATMGAYCGEFSLLSLADWFNRPIYSYESFIDDPNTGSYFFDDVDFDTLSALFAARYMGTIHHRSCKPFSDQNDAYEGRAPLKVLFNVNHFTALLNKEPHVDLVPNTDLFNVHSLALLPSEWYNTKTKVVFKFDTVKKAIYDKCHTHALKRWGFRLC